MANTKPKETKMAEHQVGPFEDVKIQEALTIIAVYAAQMDYENCEADVERIVAILDHHPEFVARRKEIFPLVNKFVNAIKVSDPVKVLKIAANALTPEQRRVGFELGVKVAQPDQNLSADKKRMFDTLKAQLSISDEFARQLLGKNDS